VELRAPLRPGPATGAAIAALRESVAGPGPDRFLAPDIEAAYLLVRSGQLVTAALRDAPPAPHDAPRGASALTKENA
ncbi:MAG: hypothetical protein QM633_00980, partial [Propionicimonas sp.]